MIIIIGSTIDDILYFASKLKNKKEYILFKKYRVLVGTILNRPVCLLGDIHTDYVTSAITMHLIEKFNAIMVINIGLCRSFSENIKKGDIVLARQIYLGDVNQIGVDDCVLGQVPSLPPYILGHPYVTEILRNGGNRIAAGHFKVATFVCNNEFNKTKKRLEFCSENDTIFGHSKDVVIDSESGGAAVASLICDVPYVAIKICEGEIEEKLSMEHMFDAFKLYPEIGKIITYCIGEIGRNDMLGVTKS